MQYVMEVAKAKIAEMTRQNYRQRFREEADARVVLPALAAEAAIWGGTGGMVGAIAGAVGSVGKAKPEARSLKNKLALDFYALFSLMAHNNL